MEPELETLHTKRSHHGKPRRRPLGRVHDDAAGEAPDILPWCACFALSGVRPSNNQSSINQSIEARVTAAVDV